MEIDWSAVLSGTITFALLFILKSLLDLRAAQYLVKWLSWLPVRNIFREKPLQIKGHWEQVWESGGSSSFQSETDRHSHPEISQLGSYCYAEFIAKGTTYVVFGRIVGEYWVGDWYDKKDPRGYFGAFQLLIQTSNFMTGKWIGHSKSKQEIKADIWQWKRTAA